MGGGGERERESGKDDESPRVNHIGLGLVTSFVSQLLFKHTSWHVARGVIASPAWHLKTRPCICCSPSWALRRPWTAALREKCPTNQERNPKTSACKRQSNFHWVMWLQLSFQADTANIGCWCPLVVIDELVKTPFQPSRTKVNFGCGRVTPVHKHHQHAMYCYITWITETHWCSTLYSPGTPSWR